MIKIQFETIDEAIEHARDRGGWIFYGNYGTALWYDAAKFTRTAVLEDSPGPGFVATHGEMRERVEEQRAIHESQQEMIELRHAHIRKEAPWILS